MRKTVGEFLIDFLESYGVDTVFGIPGVHTVELYRGLAKSGIRHITPRHELNAGFMADGYARASGKPGVCLLITGPGLTNVITAMAQARADSIPMLIISGVNNAIDRGDEVGHLHELPDQIGMLRTIALSAQTLERGADLEAVIERAFTAMTAARPGPVHIEIPLNVMSELIDQPDIQPRKVAVAVAADPDGLKQAAQICRAANRPVILVGGGAKNADIKQLAEPMDAPVVTTTNARGVMAGHDLLVPASPSLAPVRQLLGNADVVIAVGTQFGPTDFDMYVDGQFPKLQNLIRIDVDVDQARKGQVADHTLIGDAAQTIAKLAQILQTHAGQNDGAERAKATRLAAQAALPTSYVKGIEVLRTINTVLPDCVIVGDSTQLVYAGNMYFEANKPSSWFNSATGYGALGFGAPAAIGAQLALGDRPVVCLSGDGGFQFCLSELGTAMDEKTPVIFVIWNNQGYQEIESYMIENKILPIGVTPTAPDFVQVANAYGMAAERIDDPANLAAALIRADAIKQPYLIEIRVD